MTLRSKGRWSVIATICLPVGIVSSAVAQTVRTDIEIRISEFQDSTGTRTWTVSGNGEGFAFPDITQIVLPNGDRLDFERRFLPNQPLFLRSFPSLKDAIGFVVGDWRISVDDPFAPDADPEGIAIRGFSIDPFASSSFFTGRPKLVSPRDGLQSANFEPILVDWRYEGEEPQPLATSNVEIRWTSSNNSVSLLSPDYLPPVTPVPELDRNLGFGTQIGSGSAGDSPYRFNFVVGLADELLPLPIDFRVGSWVDLTDRFVRQDSYEPFPGLIDRPARLAFTNFADTVTVTIVPEPRLAWMMALACALIPSVDRKRS